MQVGTMEARTTGDLPSSDHGESKVDRIYLALKQRICTNVIGPGEPIFETQVAEEFCVSRTPVSRAFARLERDGLLRTRRGVGSYTTELDLDMFEDCYRLRIRLAELIGESARRQATLSVAARLEALLATGSSLRSARNYKAIGEVNVGVMYAVLDMIGNAALREITETLYFKTTRIWHSAIPNLCWEEEVAFVIAEIEDLLRALRFEDYATFGQVRRNYTSLAFHRLRQRWPVPPTMPPMAG